MSFGKIDLGSVSCTPSTFSHLYNYFEAQNISGCNRREPQTAPALSLWDIFPLMTGRSVMGRDDLSPLISSVKTPYTQGEVIIFLRANMSDVSFFILVLVK